MIIVEVLGYGGASNLAPTDDERRRDKDKVIGRACVRIEQLAQVVGFGNLTGQRSGL